MDAKSRMLDKQERLYMCGSYDNYYSQGSYDRLHECRYDGDGTGGRMNYDRLSYGAASEPRYRREYSNYDRRADYDYYRLGPGYRGAETRYSTDQSYARDIPRPCPAPARPKALSKAAGKA
jgi:hypothetical protein